MTRILALLIIALLAFGGIFHASVPHTHPDNVVVVDLFHSAAHPGTKDEYLAVIDVAFLALVIFAVSLGSRKSFQYTLRRESNALLSALRRGILPYRRFG